jgi:hypothetical protein
MVALTQKSLVVQVDGLNFQAVEFDRVNYVFPRCDKFGLETRYFHLCVIHYVTPIHDYAFVKIDRIHDGKIVECR